MNKIRIVRLGTDTTPQQIQQFVDMMQRMYDFHATLHDDWKTRSDWKKGSERWINSAGNKDDYFFAIAYLNTGEDFQVDKVQPIGYVIASFHYEAPLFLQNRFGYIADLWVEETYRQRGVARSLFEAAKDWCKTQGVERIQLEVDVENDPGQKFWHKLGFEDFEIVMRKTLA